MVTTAAKRLDMKGTRLKNDVYCSKDGSYVAWGTSCYEIKIEELRIGSRMFESAKQSCEREPETAVAVPSAPCTPPERHWPNSGSARDDEAETAVAAMEEEQWPKPVINAIGHGG